MAIIDPAGLFGGDRLRRCSNQAQLHWPRFYLASDGFGRLEINYAKIVGRAYSTFNPIPDQEEIYGYIREYSDRYLLFIYEGNGQQWGQWDTRPEFLPRYKTSQDRRSPIPDVRQFQEWKSRYVVDCSSFPKCFGNFSPRVETFPSGVGVGGGVGIGVGVGENHTQKPPRVLISDSKPSGRFEEFWARYPRKVGREKSAHAWCFCVTAENEAQVFAALDRYLDSAEVSRGVVMSAEKWLNSQAVDGWAGMWPARNGVVAHVPKPHVPGPNEWRDK